MSLAEEERRAAFGTRLQVRRRAVRDFWWFCRWAIGDMAFQGNAEAIDNPFHRRMAGFISAPSQKRLAVILEPRGHLKSTICTILHSIWMMMLDPTERILIVHGIDDKALAMLDELKMVLVASEKLKWIAPDVFYEDPEKESAHWRSDAISIKRPYNDKVPSISACGLTGTQASSHFSRIKGDDIVNERNCQTAEQLEKATLAFKRHQNLLRNEQSKYDFIGTIWNYHDTSGWILDPKNGMTDITRSLIGSCWDGDWQSVPEEERVPVWPQAKSRKFLMDARLTMGSHEFSQQMLCVRIIEGTMVFNEADVQRYDPQWETDRQGQPVLVLPGMEAHATPEERVTYYYTTSTDSNTRESTAYDAGVVLTVAKDSSGNVYVVDMKRGHPSQATWLGWCREAVQLWKPKRLTIEVVGFQKTIVESLNADTKVSGVHYPIHEVTRGGDNKKYERIRGLQPLVERGQLFVPVGSKYEPLMEEIRAYSTAAKMDDCLDCLADAVALGPAPPKKAMKETVTNRDPFDLRRNVFGFQDGVIQRSGVRELSRLRFRG